VKLLPLLGPISAVCLDAEILTRGGVSFAATEQLGAIYACGLNGAPCWQTLLMDIAGLL